MSVGALISKYYGFARDAFNAGNIQAKDAKSAFRISVSGYFRGMLIATITVFPIVIFIGSLGRFIEEPTYNHFIKSFTQPLVMSPLMAAVGVGLGLHSLIVSIIVSLVSIRVKMNARFLIVLAAIFGGLIGGIPFGHYLYYIVLGIGCAVVVALTTIHKATRQ
jgi:hypothetical protein